MRRPLYFWLLLGSALLVGAQTTVDRYLRIGQPGPGFSVLENLLVAVGGGERSELEPLDLVRAVNGQVLSSGREIQAEIARHPAGTRFHYILYRQGRLVEADVTSRLMSRRDFFRFLAEGLLPGIMVLALGGLVFYLKPGTSWSRLFLGFSLVSYLVSVTYADAHSTYRFTPLFLTAWALWPATLMHAALIFPQRRSVVRRFPRVVWVPYVLSAVVAALLQLRISGDYVGRFGLVVGAAAAYWGLALIVLIVALARTSVAGATPLVRQRARVLTAAFAIGYLPAVLGTMIEALFRVTVPRLETLWRLNFVFPAAMAYAMIRYDLFDVRAAIRAGTVYSAATGVVVMAYAGAIAVLNLALSSLELSTSPMVSAAVVALAVVLFLNPVYARTRRVVDRVFFRQRFDIQRSIERVSELMTSLLDLGRIVGLLTQTVDELLHPVRQTLLLYDEASRGYLVAGDESADAPQVLSEEAALPTALLRLRVPLTRERVEEDPDLGSLRRECLAAMNALKAELVVPIVFRGRLTGFLALAAKRSESAYSTEDLRFLRLLVNQSALALEHAKAYTALGTVNVELKAALRRVEILESIRSNLSKFVPKTVQDLIERAPEAPALDKREADVSVLFVDIVGYTRLSERLDPARVNELVERYFGAFLDEILKRGGDVNETAGDGLMVIFQDPDRRRHARAAVKTGLAILRRAQEINDRLGGRSEPIAVHVGVNSGLATVGATKIEGATGIRWTYTASGPVTNVAARLAALSDGEAVAVGWETRERLGGEFAFEPLGARALRNVEHPVPVYRLAPPPVSALLT